MGEYVFTPARRAALERARAKSALARRGRAHRIYGHNPITRGVGVAGLKKNFVPHVRVNQRSQTGGFNAGTVIPGTQKRIVLGAYVRLENTQRKGAISKALSATGRSIAPHGTKRGTVRNYLKTNVQVKNPAIRAKVGGAELRLGTSRGAGPTLIARRGRAKTPQKISARGVQKYDRSMRSVAGKKARKPRRARRG